MNSRLLHSLFFVVLSVSSTLSAQTASSGSAPKSSGDSSNHPLSLTKLPEGVILVKGAWSSASDSVTPVPEDGNVANGVFTDPYFGMRYPLPLNWIQEYEGPPPSESGRYVLAQVEPPDSDKKPVAGSILITAQDMFFTPFPTANAQELTSYLRNHLQADYKVETELTQTNVAGRTFAFFAYWSPVAQLHWYVLATQIRCHAVQLVLTSRNVKLLDRLMLDLNTMKLPEDASPTAGAGGGLVPRCIQDYVRDENVIRRVDPVFTEHRFNSVPVRIIIDKEGKVKHIHFISAFPDQARAISDALEQWKFKPYQWNGQEVEVETGVLFGRAPRTTTPSTTGSAVK